MASQAVRNYSLANLTNSSLSEKELNQLSVARGVASIVAFVGCCFTLLLMLYFQAFRTTLQRLILYLSIAQTAQLATEILQITTGNDAYCTVVGFLNQYTLYVMVLFTLSVVVYLFHRVRKSSVNRRKTTNPIVPPKIITCEAYYVAFAIIFPLLYSCIPFFTNAYGGRPWCWIIAVEKDNCSGDLSGFLTLLLVGIIPALVIINFCALLILVTALLYCWWSSRFKEVRRTLTHEACTTVMLIVVNSSYLVTGAFFTIGTIRFYLKGEEYPFEVLLFYAISLPVSQMFVPVSFAVYTLQRKRRKIAKQNPRNTRQSRMGHYFKNYGTLKEEAKCKVEGSETEETFHRSVVVQIPSTTCYPKLYEFSDEFDSSSDALLQSYCGDKTAEGTCAP